MIEFYSEDNLVLPALKEEEVKLWINKVAGTYGLSVGELCYFFCTDEYILQANREFLQHDYYTDIITFDRREGSCVNGDLLISLETVKSNAEALGLPFEEELHRVIIHGVLHILGLGDKEEEEAQLMRQAEDKALALLHELLGADVRLLKEDYKALD